MSSNLAVQNDELRELAISLGLDPVALEAQSSFRSGGSVYTNFTRLEDARIVNGPKWLDGGIFKWCQPGQPDYPEDVEGMSEINQLGGIVVHYEVQGSLQEKSEEGAERNERICSVVGYRNPLDGSYIKALPDFYPLKSMYGGWDKESNSPVRNSPNSIVSDLDLLGSRGMRCVDCIKSCQSFIVGDDGKVNGECSLYGKLYFYITSLTRVKLIPPKKGSGAEPQEMVETKQISEIFPGETGILVMINLPTVTGIRGKWSKDEKVNIRGFANYMIDLQMKFSGIRKSPVMNFTTISLKKPPADSKSTKNLLHFDHEDSFDYSLIKDAREAWNAAKPSEPIQELDIANYGGVAVSNAPALSSAATNPDEVYTVASSVVEDIIPF